MKKHKIVLLLLLVWIVLRPAFARPFDHSVGSWNDFHTYGRFFNEKLYYQAEFHLRFLSEDPIFDQVILHFGLSYDVAPSVRLGAGYEFLPSYEVFTERLEYEQRTLQQAFIHLGDGPKFSLDSRTELEQRDDLDERGVAWRLRQMLTLLFRSRAESKVKVTPFISEELFFNLNHPIWVSRDTYSQNRLYFGVLIPFRKYFTIRVSYLNQIILGGRIKDMNHILAVSFALNHDLL